MVVAEVKRGVNMTVMVERMSPCGAGGENNGGGDSSGRIEVEGEGGSYHMYHSNGAQHKSKEMSSPQKQHLCSICPLHKEP